MHFAYPGRKSSVPTNFTPRQNRNSILHNIRRRVRLRTLLVGSAIIGLLYLILSWLLSPSSTRPSSPGFKPAMTKAPGGQPNVVLVTVMDDTRGQAFNEAIKKNREAYAEKHGMRWAHQFLGQVPLTTAAVQATQPSSQTSKTTNSATRLPHGPKSQRCVTP